jgi:hypothetical protein
MKKDFQPEQKPNNEPLFIDSTSSPNCTKPNVGCSTFSNDAKLINEVVWNKIFEDLGEVTDFELLEFKGGFVEPRIKFKSNGVEKSIFCTDKNLKDILLSFMYAAEHFNVVKKYKPYF